MVGKFTPLGTCIVRSQLMPGTIINSRCTWLCITWLQTQICCCQSTKVAPGLVSLELPQGKQQQQISLAIGKRQQAVMMALLAFVCGCCAQDLLQGHEFT